MALKKLASLGITVLASSGDYEASQFPGEQCFSTEQGGLNTDWPACSQWVTTV